MKCAVTVKSVTHLVETGCADLLVEGILNLEKERDALKAEVERLEGLVKYWQIEAETDHAHWVRHAEANERLRKAGDAMADAINEHRHGKGGAWGEGFIVREKWKTAKEGKGHA